MISRVTLSISSTFTADDRGRLVSEVPGSLVVSWMTGDPDFPMSLMLFSDPCDIAPWAADQDFDPEGVTVFASSSVHEAIEEGDKASVERFTAFLRAFGRAVPIAPECE